MTIVLIPGEPEKIRILGDNASEATRQYFGIDISLVFDGYIQNAMVTCYSSHEGRGAWAHLDIAYSFVTLVRTMVGGEGCEYVSREFDNFTG